MHWFCVHVFVGISPESGPVSIRPPATGGPGAGAICNDVYKVLGYLMSDTSAMDGVCPHTK